MIRRLLFTAFIIVMMTLGAALGAHTGVASPAQPTADSHGLYNNPGYWEYRWFCYNAPQLTYNLQLVNAAYYKRWVSIDNYASGRVIYYGPWQWVQNAWQWFCPQY